METIFNTIAQHRPEFSFLMGPFLRLLQSPEFRPQCLASLGNHFAKDRLLQIEGGNAAAMASIFH
ncbi:MAG: hypothetical protein K8R69_02620 [Deltaproteobacteria bacterium]|nr:hypothetical protein [Deltaproteobacteria bacterium]